jgi:hypothetical protein
MLPILLAVSLAAPVPKARDGALYFPVQQGTKRVLVTTSAGTTAETTETVTKAEVKDGALVVTLEREVGGRTVTMEFTVSASGVSRRSSPGDEPLAVFQPLAGATWESATPSQRTKYTVGPAEEVKVPAGTYQAIPVVSETDIEGQVFRSTSWYAAGVGVVKTVSGSRPGERVQVLKEFTPGK